AKRREVREEAKDKKIKWVYQGTDPETKRPVYYNPENPEETKMGPKPVEAKPSSKGKGGRNPRAEMRGDKDKPMATMPPASENKGKIIKEVDANGKPTGKRFKSDGKDWKEI
ncbi:MAG: hypothetical protein ABSD38_01980, partial [Syntrophorhabdales bacterium]